MLFVIVATLVGLFYLYEQAKDLIMSHKTIQDNNHQASRANSAAASNKGQGTLADLFRMEALNAQKPDLYSGAIVGTSLPIWSLVGVSLFFAIALIVFACVGTYAKKERVTGLLAPVGGASNVTAPLPAYIQHIKVREGELVQAGQVLIELNNEKTTLQNGTPINAGVSTQQQYQQRKDSLTTDANQRRQSSELRRQTINQRNALLASEMRQIDQEINLQSTKTKLAADNLQRNIELERDHLISANVLQQIQENLIDQESRLATLKRNKLTLDREQQMLMGELHQLEQEASSTQATMEREITTLNQESLQTAVQTQNAIIAPVAGIVSALPIHEGQYIDAGGLLATVQPKDALLQGELYIPSRAIGQTKMGQSVLLRYNAYPYQKFGLYSGQITQISPSAIALTDLPKALQVFYQGGNPQATTETLYKISVQLPQQTITRKDEQHDLRAGMSFEADIVQEKRRIIEWIFEPLLSLNKS